MPDINRYFAHFTNKFGNPGNFGTHFDINPNYTIKTFIPNIENRIINVTLIYSENQPIFYFPALPTEISEYIDKFLKSYKIHVQIHIKFNDDYPFSSPEFKIVGFKNTLKVGIDKEIYIYLKYKTKLYNEKISKTWTPALLIEKTILDFFTTINNFDELSY